jgi:hypothetical protein
MKSLEKILTTRLSDFLESNSSLKVSFNLASANQTQLYAVWSTSLRRFTRNTRPLQDFCDLSIAFDTLKNLLN